MADDPIHAAVATGRERLFAQHPEFAREADAAATDAIAHAHGISKTELYETEIEKHVSKHAKSLGVGVIEMLLSLGANSEDEERDLLALHQSRMNTDLER